MAIGPYLALQDEVLAHRLGLIPLDANPALFEYKTRKLGGSAGFASLRLAKATLCLSDYVYLYLYSLCRRRNCQ